MSKVLDLSVFSEETFDITFPNKEVIHIKKPTQQIVITMVSVSNQANNENQVGVMDAMVDLCAAILSNNREGKEYTADWIAANLDIMMVCAIIKGYSDFTQEIQSNPI